MATPKVNTLVRETIVDIARGVETSEGQVTVTARQWEELEGSISGERTPAGGFLVNCQELCDLVLPERSAMERAAAAFPPERGLGTGARVRKQEPTGKEPDPSTIRPRGGTLRADNLASSVEVPEEDRNPPPPPEQPQTWATGAAGGPRQRPRRASEGLPPEEEQDWNRPFDNPPPTFPAVEGTPTPEGGVLVPPELPDAPAPKRPEESPKGLPKRK